MKKGIKKLIIITSIIVATVVLIIVGASVYRNTGISENYAERINNAYATGDPFTYNEIVLRLGTPIYNEAEGTPTTMTGDCDWYKGYTSNQLEKFKEDFRSGKDISVITIKFENGIAVKAQFSTGNRDTELETK